MAALVETINLEHTGNGPTEQDIVNLVETVRIEDPSDSPMNQEPTEEEIDLLLHVEDDEETERIRLEARRDLEERLKDTNTRKSISSMGNSTEMAARKSHDLETNFSGIGAKIASSKMQKGMKQKGWGAKRKVKP